jgi:hypothetical protein
MGLLALAVVGLALATGPVSIEHEELGDSHNPTRTFCIRLKNVAPDTPLQPSVMFRFRNDSQQILLQQDNQDNEVFRGTHTFNGTGHVEYIITAGNVFWTPKGASFGAFDQLETTTTTTTTATTTLATTVTSTKPHVARHTYTGNDDGDHHIHYSYGWNAWFFVWIAIALLIGATIFFLL